MKRSLFKILIALIITLSFGLSDSSAREKIHAAVAANYIQVFKELSLSFEKQTGIKVETTFASSGNLYSQITNSAPYDIFLSADKERPALLYRDGLAEEPFTYGTGQVILWSS